MTNAAQQLPAVPVPATDIGSLGPQRGPRGLHTFKVPKRIADISGVSTIGIVEITAREHNMAMQRAKDGNSQMASGAIAGYELALESLRMVNDQKVTTADGSADAIWNACGQPLRELVTMAYGEVNNPKKDEAEDFLKSRGLKTA